ncbi:TetR/AcrR family transcriptional regulator [Streptomyces sp. NPDC127033]|uniref:TetR/AcrR family transcriptional regulator n=1 Tax=Streptomyces sp. NPDC127033 TaxID=3347110 RepID=UPI00364B1D21
MTPASDSAYPTDVRAALLAAARAELLENGAGGLSLRAIAARAGVSRATPKWHFGHRAGLLTALAVEGFAELGQVLGAAVEGAAGPAARFTALGRAYMDFGLRNPELFDLMFRSAELDRDDPALGRAHRASFSILVDTATEAAGGMAGGGAGTQDVPLLAWAASHGLVLLVHGGALQTLTGLTSSDEAGALAHRLADTFTELVRASGEATP